MKRLAALLLACLAALALAREASADSFGCGLPETRPLWIEFADGSVPFRQALFGKLGVVVATNGVERAAEMRGLGAQTVYWHMFLKGLAGTPTAPNDPALVQERTLALIEKARASTGCDTPLIGLNELNGVSRPTPWPPEVAQYRANVLEAFRLLAQAGARPFLLVPGQARGPRAPWVGDTAADWWRQIAQYGSIVREMHFNAPYIYKQGAIVGSRTRRVAMRQAIGALAGLGIPADRLGLLLGFQSGPGKGGREGLRPTSAWLEIVKRDALAAQQVARELGLATIWSWGWGTFNAAGADPDKPVAACVYLWARDPSLCDGLAAAGPGFDASLTEGQIMLPGGVQCSTSIGTIPLSAAEDIAGVTGDRGSALTALLTQLVYERYGAGVSRSDLDRGEAAVVDGGFGGDWQAYEAELAARGLNRKIARDIVAGGFRRQALVARLTAEGRFPPGWIAAKQRAAFRSAICLNDELPSAQVFNWSGLLPFLDVPPGSISIAVQPKAVRRGAPVVLSGTVASARAREVVTVYARGAEQASFGVVGRARVGGGGTWRLQVTPRTRTLYRAASLAAASPQVAVRVRG
jgi:hypothetical protein